MILLHSEMKVTKLTLIEFENLKHNLHGTIDENFSLVQ